MPPVLDLEIDAAPNFSVALGNVDISAGAGMTLRIAERLVPAGIDAAEIAAFEAATGHSMVAVGDQERLMSLIGTTRTLPSCLV